MTEKIRMGASAPIPLIPGKQQLVLDVIVVFRVEILGRNEIDVAVPGVVDENVKKRSDFSAFIADCLQIVPGMGEIGLQLFCKFIIVRDGSSEYAIKVG